MWWDLLLWQKLGAKAYSGTAAPWVNPDLILAKAGSVRKALMSCRILMLLS